MPLSPGDGGGTRRGVQEEALPPLLESVRLAAASRQAEQPDHRGVPRSAGRPSPFRHHSVRLQAAS